MDPLKKMEISASANSALHDTMPKLNILIIDDEENNLRILKAHLEGAHYNTLIARDGAEAWNILKNSYHNIHIILLDRMMPKMDGMELLKKIKGHPEMQSIPVVMQTAAALQHQIIEGIDAGVYYYLTKPFDEKVLLSVVGSAAQSYLNNRLLLEKVNKGKQMLGLVKESAFQFNTLEEVKDLAPFIANFYPDPERVILGISELMTNAIEHGNLGIGYDKKTELLLNGVWPEEITRRQNLPENKEKTVQVHYQKTPHTIVLTIRDSGKGFDWRPFLEISTDRATHNHGRGIALANMLSFDKLEYLGKGNEVRCTVTV